MSPDAGKRLVRAWLLTALIDGAFSGILAQFFYGSSAKRLFQGVAATLLGPSALEGGTRTMLIGMLMHVTVAFTWSLVFLLIAERSRFVRDVLASPGGIFKVAAIYGPCIWMFMSLIVIQTLTKRPPNFNIRWWIQFFGHIPFVALPIVASIAPKRR